MREYPHQLSGGLCQRVLVAMAVACRPALVIADEPTTALDATVQAQILELLREMRVRHGLALLLVTHDLGVAAAMADRVAVMYAGRLVEQAPVADLFRSPAHPYTRGLLAAVPIGRRRVVPMDGNVPPPGAMPRGCRFAPRCPERMTECEMSAPLLALVGEGHWTACHRRHPASPAPGLPGR
jgi:oligopeptide/dipeptide ABC transporter ATP-binding protein